MAPHRPQRSGGVAAYLEAEGRGEAEGRVLGDMSEANVSASKIYTIYSPSATS